jgi:hypothetical protein
MYALLQPVRLTKEAFHAPGAGQHQQHEQGAPHLLYQRAACNHTTLTCEEGERSTEAHSSEGVKQVRAIGRGL